MALKSQKLSFEYISEHISLSIFVLSLALIVTGKILVILLVRGVLISSGEDRGLTFAWYAYSRADIAKYIPGGIWGLTSRLVIYRRVGIGLSTGGKLLLAETGILVVASFTSGTFFVAISELSAVWSIACGFAAGVLIFVFGKAVVPMVTRHGAAVIALQQFSAWILFGISFAIMVPMSPASWPHLAGIFNVGFAAGTIAIFAPSGIGVREFVVGWLASRVGDLSIQNLIELSLLHRAVWIVADLLVFVPTLLRPYTAPKK
jgi:glycosyltransferase 2 family protein